MTSKSEIPDMNISTTICSVRFAITSNAKPYLGNKVPRECLQDALDNLVMGRSLSALYWLCDNILEAKVIPYEVD
jgi:hypothetical protein